MPGDIWVLKGSGQVLENVHREGECAGHFCTIHNPAPGPWADWPMKYIANIVMARMCPHGFGHPSVEDIMNRSAYADHYCDGCPCGIEHVDWGNDAD